MELCVSDKLQIDLHDLNACKCSDTSVDWTCFDLDSRSAITFSHPGMHLALRVIR